MHPRRKMAPRACVVAVAVWAATDAATAPLFPTIVTDVPGRPASQHFSADVFYEGAWTPIYVFETTSKVDDNKSNGYFGHQNNWTASWVSSQLTGGGGEELLLRVRRLGDAAAPIVSAVVHPASAAIRVVNISADGTVTLAASASARAAVDFDGALDDVDTGPSYAGPPVHTFCWFVDAPVSPSGLPDPSAPGSVVVRPGDPLPNASSLHPGAWPTVIFAPGVHRAGPGQGAPHNWTVLTLAPNTRYFLCAGAVVHAALKVPDKAANIILDGFGVLTGEDMVRADTPSGNPSPQGLSGLFVDNATITGFTMVDFPNHHIVIGGETTVNNMSNIKILGWRSNGDGLHVFFTWKVSDMFMRTQDDSMYLACGPGCTTVFERITTWNDANGCAFIFSASGGDSQGVTLRDSAVIYARASWAYWTGGRIFCHRSAFTDKVMAGVTIDNVVVEDRLPSLNAFQLDMTNSNGVRDAVFANVTFSNIVIGNWSTTKHYLNGTKLPFGLPNLMNAVGSNVTFENVAFNNVSIAGEPLATTFSDPAKWLLSGPSTLVNCTVDGAPIT